MLILEVKDRINVFFSKKMFIQILLELRGYNFFKIKWDNFVFRGYLSLKFSLLHVINPMICKIWYRILLKL